MSSNRIYYNQTDVYRKLVDEEGIFDKYKDTLVFLAAVGYSEGSKEALPEEKENEIRWEYIRDPTEKLFIKSLAYADTQDTDVLSDIEKQIEILLKYSAGGEEVIRREVIDRPGNTLNNLLDYLEENREESVYGKNSGILSKIEEEIESVA